MPNGNKVPYRLDPSNPQSPSPLHTSDSEATKENKHQFHLNRCVDYLEQMRLLPLMLRTVADVVVNIAEYAHKV